ncbi:hypothetical protein Q8A67_020217 [Cirrhinus molitorella]|uniref:Uncharacterized protein n=1 Tax=Cirrhinus molitorella TaxID=172907 RepID=A0AA88PD13_9TELE|nr:hypothetical protein Q8A67_020217 [Cirrhinus molitorella]
MASTIARMHGGFCQKRRIYPPSHGASERKCLQSVGICKGGMGEREKNKIKGTRTGGNGKSRGRKAWDEIQRIHQWPSQVKDLRCSNCERPRGCGRPRSSQVQEFTAGSVGRGTGRLPVLASNTYQEQRADGQRLISGTCGSTSPLGQRDGPCSCWDPPPLLSLDFKASENCKGKVLMSQEEK